MENTVTTIRRCKYCGRELISQDKLDVFCCALCHKYYEINARKSGYITDGQSICTVCGDKFEIIKGRPAKKCPRCAENPVSGGLVELNKRELSSIQLQYIAEDVAKNRNIKKAAADFGWRGKEGFAIFESKLEEKRPEYDWYLAKAKEQVRKRKGTAVGRSYR